MLSKFLDKIQGYNKKQVKFIVDLNSVLNKLEGSSRIFATHGHCADGAVVGGMLRNEFPGAKIIPVDYWFLNDDLASSILSAVKWDGIFDLKPFNRETMEFWVDHHISSIGAAPHARKIRFDSNGESAAYQLYLSKFLSPVPEHLLDLVLMTRITDTAGFITPLPVTPVETLEELQYEPTHQREKDLPLYEKKAWLLNDAAGITITYKEHQRFYTGIAKDGFYYLGNLLKQVNTMRDKRLKHFEIADSLETASVLVFIFNELDIDPFPLRRRLLTSKPVKVVISLAKYKGGIKISIRRKKGLSQEENTKIQTQTLAASMNGGGHPGASGAHTETLETALKLIKQWASKLDLSIIAHEVTEKLL